VQEPTSDRDQRGLATATRAVIIALVFWGSLWGIVGAFLCVPLTGILVIILSNFPGTRRVSPEFHVVGALLKIDFAAISPAWVLGAGCFERLIRVR
jgi:hypothetical protein